MQTKMVTETDLLNLRNQLPYGYSKTLQTRILKKHKKSYALISIRKGLMSKHKNELIIREALDYLHELQTQGSILSDEIKKLA